MITENFIFLIWSAPAERSGDGALDEKLLGLSYMIQSGVALALAAALQIAYAVALLS